MTSPILSLLRETLIVSLAATITLCFGGTLAVYLFIIKPTGVITGNVNVLKNKISYPEELVSKCEKDSYPSQNSPSVKIALLPASDKHRVNYILNGYTVRTPFKNNIDGSYLSKPLARAALDEISRNKIDVSFDGIPMWDLRVGNAEIIDPDGKPINEIYFSCCSNDADRRLGLGYLARAQINCTLRDDDHRLIEKIKSYHPSVIYSLN
jgi:hypothetical protein